MRELRPGFELETEERLADFMARISQRLRSPGSPLCGVAAGDRVELYVPPARQRLWSPELRLTLTETQRGLSIEGAYALHPHVWVGYVAVHALTVVAIVAAFTLAYAEWTMKQPAVALFAVPPLALLGGSTWAFAFAAQRLGTSEMDELRAFVDDIVFSSAPLPSGVRHRIPAGTDAVRDRAASG